MPEGWRWTHCGRMDQGGCRLLVKIKEGRIVKIKPDPAGLLNQGYACPKGLASPERLSRPGRLTRPLRRKKSGLRPIPWSEALEEIAVRFEAIKAAHGARAVSFCQGMPKGLEHFGLIRLANTFGSPNVVGPQNVCHMPREISGVHTCGFYPVVAYDQPSEGVLLFGSNPSATNEEGLIHVQLLAQLKNGARLVVVDPQRTDMARRAEVWLQLRPGSETALALSFVAVVIEEELFDRQFVDNYTHGFDELAAHALKYKPEETAPHTWLEPDLVRQAARLYAEAKPAALHWGNGVEHSSSNFDTCRALICLMALCGNLDAPGGNVDAGSPPLKSLRQFVRADLMPQKYKEMVSFAHGVLPRFMVVPPPHWRRAILKSEPYPIKAAFVQTSNPVISYSNSAETAEALQSLDFLVVSEITMTPTAALADVVLPAATQFEFNDIGHYGLGHGYVLARPRLVDPPPECWPDLKIQNELAKRLGLGQWWWSDYEDIVEDLLTPSGLSYAELVARGGLLAVEPELWKYKKGGFKTPTGKVELVLSRAEKMGFEALPRFSGPPLAEDADLPLILNSAKCKDFLCSSDRGLEALRRLRPRPIVKIHPDTAQRLGIKDGRPVRITTPQGSIVQFARLWDGVHQRVVTADPGWWFPEKGLDWSEANLNVLTASQPLSKAFGTPNLRALPCRVEPVEAEPDE